MAKKSLIAREHKREQLIKKYAGLHDKLKKIVKSSSASDEERSAAQQKIQTLPVNSLAIRHRRRCRNCGRPRGVYRKFALCRIHLREALMNGNVPGGRKASW